MGQQLQLGPPLPDGRAEPLPRGLRDQPVHGPRTTSPTRCAPASSGSALVEAIRAAGAEVEVLAQRPDAPDMVYAMNLGLVVNAGPAVEDRASCSRTCATPSAATETLTAQPWFAEHGFAGSYVGRDGVGAHFEAGDAFAFGDALVVGYGPRTEELALKHLATDLDVRVRGLRITHPGMYHLDLAFCPLDETRAMVCPAAFDEASAAAAARAGARAAGAHRGGGADVLRQLGRGRPTILMPACPDRVRAQLEDWGFEIVLVDVGEFHKGGGSVRCLTNPLDVVARPRPARTSPAARSSCPDRRPTPGTGPRSSSRGPAPEVPHPGSPGPVLVGLAQAGRSADRPDRRRRGPPRAVGTPRVSLPGGSPPRPNGSKRTSGRLSPGAVARRAPGTGARVWASTMPATTATPPSSATVSSDSENHTQPSALTPIGSSIATIVTVVAGRCRSASSASPNGSSVPTTTIQASTAQTGAVCSASRPSSETRSPSRSRRVPVSGCTRFRPTVGDAGTTRGSPAAGRAGRRRARRSGSTSRSRPPPRGRRARRPRRRSSPRQIPVAAASPAQASARPSPQPGPDPLVLHEPRPQRDQDRRLVLQQQRHPDRQPVDRDEVGPLQRGHPDQAVHHDAAGRAGRAAGAARPAGTARRPAAAGRCR